MTATTKRATSAYVSLDHLEGPHAGYLAAKLRERGFLGLFDSDQVSHQVHMAGDGTERHQVIISTEGVENVADALRLLADHVADVVVDGQLVATDDDLMKLVEATTEAEAKVKARAAEKARPVARVKSGIARLNDLFSFIGLWVVLMAALYGLTHLIAWIVGSFVG